LREEVLSKCLSLEEAAEKLIKTEGEVRQLAKDGKLREFRDGSNLLFKIEEVESLMSDTTVSEALEAQPVSEPAESVELEEAERPESTMEPEPTVEPEEAQAYEPAPEPEPIFEPETAQAPEEVPEPEPVVEPEAAQEPETASEPEPVLEPETAQVSEPALEPESATEQEEEEEISLAPEAAASGSEKDVSNLDTAMTGEGISVLGEADRDYKLTDDTMVLIEANPEQYKLKGQFKLPKRDGMDGPGWPHPVIVDGKLYIRHADVLFCYDITER